MISQITFHRIHSTCIRPTRALTTAVLCSALVLISALTFYPERLGHAANHKRQQLTFEDRVAAQRAIEEVYHQRRIWPKDNPQPKPPLSEVLPDEAIRAKVEDYLRKSSALEVYWQRPITPDQLQAEMERMARQSKQPDALGELWAALGNDPLLVAECLARPMLVDRLLRESYANNERRLADTEREATFDDWWRGVREEISWNEPAPDAAYQLPEIIAQPNPCLTESWLSPTQTGAPNVSSEQIAVWTGSEMIVWGGSGGRYNPATDSWTPTTMTGAPSGRSLYTAVWTGTEMIVWGGREGSNKWLNNGGRYNPMIDSWKATASTSAPIERDSHTAIWTGSEMIVWGGEDQNFKVLNNGGRYNPANDSWAPTAMAGAPNGQSGHTAVWTGGEMIVWGGYDGRGRINSGGRYNPATDSWKVIATTGAPIGRTDHTAVWTGSEMIIWGGADNNEVNSGGRYNPTTDNWTVTATTGAPNARTEHTAVWTGSEMIIWGGRNAFGFINPIPGGGRYNPMTNTWMPTTTTNDPGARFGHAWVWTGNEMIVWGGQAARGSASGGIYTPRGAPPIAPNSQDFGSGGGTGSINVLAPGACNWTATSQVTWITITSAASGTGNGMVSYSVGANPNTNLRAGGINVAGRNFTVRQAGCAVSISSTTRIFAPTAGSGSIEVISNGVCNWTARSDADWITITSGASGNSNGTVSFAVSPNQTGISRSGTLTVVDKSFTVIQVPYSNDVGVVGFDLPGGAEIGKPRTIRARVTNFGSNPQSNFPVSYQINDGAPITENYPGTLAPLQTATIVFSTPWTPTALGTYQITARTNLSDDQNAVNDVSQTTIRVVVAPAAFVRTFGGNNFDIGRSVQRTTDGGYIIAGSTSSFGAGGADVYLVKTDGAGFEQWSKTFGGSGADDAYSVRQTSDGGYVIAGSTASFGAGMGDAYLIKTDSAGNVVWSKTFGAAATSEIAREAQQTSDGGYIVVGFASASDSASVYLVKTGPDGAEQWSRSLPNRDFAYGYSVQQAADGGYILTGSARARFARSDLLLIKTNASGELTWSRSFGDTVYDQRGNCVRQTSDGGYIITGETETDRFIGFQEHVWLVKTDPSGNLVWDRRSAGGAHVYGNHVEQTSDGGYIIVGRILLFGEFSDGDDVYLIRANQNGNFLWERRFGGQLSLEEGYWAQETADGGFIITGAIWTRTPGASTDVWLIKTDSQGTLLCSTVTGINPTSGAVGANVTITGTNLADVTAVKFANNVTASFTIVSDTQIIARAPAGAATGPITISKAGCADLQTAAFTVQPSPPVASVSAASFLGAELAPESIVAAFGVGLATQTVAATDTDPNTPGIQLPTELAGTTVEIKDSAGTPRLAPLFFVSPEQVNYQMPLMTALGAGAVTVKSGDGKTLVGTVQVANVAPGLFTANASGQGVAVGLVLRVRGADQSFEPIVEFDPAQGRFVARPIDLGPEGDQVFLILYGVGFRFRSALPAVSVKIGGADMEVLYAGEAPGFIGLDQSNVRLSRSLIGRSETDVVVMVDGKTANTVRVAIK